MTSAACKPKTNRNRGAACVEAAMILPIVVMLILGSVELGMYLNNLQVVQNAARQGARAAVRLENSNAAVETAVLAALNELDVESHDVCIRISKLNSSGHTEYDVTNLSENEQGHPIRVVVSFPYSHLNPPSNFVGLATREISSSAVMRRLK